MPKVHSTKDILKTRFLGLRPVELISLLYIFLTGFYIIIFTPKVTDFNTLLLVRVLVPFVFLMMALSVKWQEKYKVLDFVRYAFPLSLIAYWYPETYYMNECLFPNLDPLFISIDQWLFGCQPSLEFSRAFPSNWLSELMYFGYFSYYIIIAFVTAYFYFTDRKLADKTLFIVLCSFFVYYILFIILPVVGPQFHFADNQVPSGYFFQKIMVSLQASGEKPTGAFPSSHVGMSLILLFIIFKYARRFWLYFVPVVVVLIFSTVYIKAHYVIDVIGGFASAPLIYWFSDRAYKWMSKIVENGERRTES